MLDRVDLTPEFKPKTKVSRRHIDMGIKDNYYFSSKILLSRKNNYLFELNQT